MRLRGGPMLLLDACRVRYPAFSGEYSLEVPRGSLCGIVGPSGGGKTTLLHVIAGFETPSSGHLLFESRDLLRLRPAERPVAMVFQDYNLFPHLTASQNIGLGIHPSLRLSPQERRRVDEPPV